ncbi:MAG: hypothetical protein ACREBD_00185 [Blastocatellia bacterium]
MARSVRVIEAPDYARGGPVRQDVEVVEPGSYGSYGGRYSIVVILVLLLIVVWIYRNGGVGAFGRLISERPATELSVSGGANPVESEVPPVVSPVVPPVIPVIPANQQSDVIGYARIATERLNLRAGPGVQYIVINILPRNWEVAVLRQLHITNDGEVWVEVMVETNQGWQRGWVSQRFLE